MPNPTDLRAALREACDLLTETIEGEGYTVAGCAPRLPEWRTLADAPLTVLDALRDLEVRAGRVRIVVAGTLSVCVVGGILMESRYVEGRGLHDGGWWTMRHPAALDLTDLDAPCRLVPAEGDHG